MLESQLLCYPDGLIDIQKGELLTYVNDLVGPFKGEEVVEFEMAHEMVYSVCLDALYPGYYSGGWQVVDGDPWLVSVSASLSAAFPEITSVYGVIPFPLSFCHDFPVLLKRS